MSNEQLYGAMSAQQRQEQEALGYCVIPGVVLAITKKDYLSSNWPKLKEAMFENIKLTYDDLIEEEMKIRKWGQPE